MTKKRKPRYPNWNNTSLEPDKLFFQRLLLSLNTKEQNTKKSKDRTKTKNLNFEKKTQPRQKRNKPVIKKARKVELKQDPPKKGAWIYNLTPGLNHQRGRPEQAL